MAVDRTVDLSWLRPKLAMLCGLDPTGSIPQGMSLIRDGEEPYGFPKYISWRPDVDVAQAIRCLEATPRRNSFFIRNLDRELWSVTIIGEDDGWQIKDASIASAICLAIAAAMGWRE